MVELHLLPSFGRNTQPPEHFKGRRKTWERREDSQVRGLCAHQTDVTGGFGPSDFEGLAARLPGKNQDQRGVPYHYFYSPRHCTVFGVWHPAWYSYHGNGANSRTIGFAVDGSYPGDELDVEALKSAARVVLSHASELGYQLSELTAHRQYSAGRGGDPGEEIWQVLELVCVEHGVLALSDFTHDDGKPIPESWRPTASPELPTEPAQPFPPLDLAELTASVVGEGVKLLQGMLLAHGFGPDGLVGSDGRPDGRAGSKTKAALDEFRARRGLEGGDVVGVGDWQSLGVPS